MPTTSSTTTRGPNKTLLRRVAARLRRLRHPEHFSQENWAEKTSCGTAACIAGFTVMELGYRLVFNIPGYERTSECRLPGSETAREIQDVAMKALRLSIPAATKLFSARPAGPLTFYDQADGDHLRLWPEPYRTAWAQDIRPQHEIAADLLDAIADGEVTL